MMKKKTYVIQHFNNLAGSIGIDSHIFGWIIEKQMKYVNILCSEDYIQGKSNIDEARDWITWRLYMLCIHVIPKELWKQPICEK